MQQKGDVLFTKSENGCSWVDLSVFLKVHAPSMRFGHSLQLKKIIVQLSQVMTMARKGLCSIYLFSASLIFRLSSIINKFSSFDSSC